MSEGKYDLIKILWILSVKRKAITSAAFHASVKILERYTGTKSINLYKWAHFYESIGFFYKLNLINQKNII